MLYRPIIRTFISCWLVLLFAFSITPKIALHSLVAHHTDTHIQGDRNVDLLGQAGFSCDTNNQVVELPYLAFSFSIDTVLPAGCADQSVAIYLSWLSSSHFIFGLRGPPALS